MDAIAYLKHETMTVTTRPYACCRAWIAGRADDLGSDGIRDRKTTATEPRRVVLELQPSESQALETLCRGKCCTVPEMVRLVALRLARAL